MATGAGTTCTREAALSLLEASPALEFVDVFIVDINGVLRGKRLRAESVLKIFELGLRMPYSAVAADIWGGDVQDSPLLFESGDRDGLCVPVGPGLQPVPWAEPPAGQLLMAMRRADGKPFLADPHQVLEALVARCRQQGVRPVAAVELEFCLFDRELDAMGRPALPPSTGKSRRVLDGRIYAVDELQAYGAFFGELYAACDAQGLPLDSAVVEAGPGQFEVNLLHRDDVLGAAEDAVLLRRAIKGVATRHGLLASFMAKPFGELAGNGMHVHMSLLDDHGSNLFDDGSEVGSPVLRQAVAGMLATAPEAMILFAPHLNSMRRFRAAFHAPTGASWGYDNRTVAIRVPASRASNRRFEHRIAGADANPYLVLAAILGGLLHGIDRQLQPPPATAGNAYAAPGGTLLPTDWAEALRIFEAGPVLAPMLGPLFTRVFGCCKRQEIAITADRITDFEYDTYLQKF